MKRKQANVQNENEDSLLKQINEDLDNLDNPETTTVKSNDEGTYQHTFVDHGDYIQIAEKPKFNPYAQQGRYLPNSNTQHEEIFEESTTTTERIEETTITSENVTQSTGFWKKIGNKVTSAYDSAKKQAKSLVEKIL